MADNSYWRSFWTSILEWYVAFAIFLVLLAAIIVLGRSISGVSVLSVALIGLSLAVVVSLLGFLWASSLVYVGLSLAWLAMAVVFIERSRAFGVNGWIAGIYWGLTNLLGLLVYSELADKMRSKAAKYRPFLFYGIFICWPAMGLLFIERGEAFGIRSWIAVGSWIVLSLVIFRVYLGARHDMVSERQEQNGL